MKVLCSKLMFVDDAWPKVMSDAVCDAPTKESMYTLVRLRTDVVSPDV